MSTAEEFDTVIARCRRIYTLKMKDYGPSWRIMRPQTVNDQLFIKAKRIRSIETTGVNMVGESIEGELMAIINYSVIGLIQLREGYSDESVKDFQPMGANFGVLPPIEPHIRDKKARYEALSVRSLQDLATYLEQEGWHV